MPVKAQAKHTPGAERAAEKIRKDWIPINPAELRPAVVAYLADLIFKETHDAEMLEALKVARQTMDKYDYLGWSDGAIGLIDEAIAKAEGR